MCKGSRCAPGTGPTNCQTCNGMGEVYFKQGMNNIVMECQSCHGEGSRIEHQCNITYYY